MENSNLSNKDQSLLLRAWVLKSSLSIRLLYHQQDSDLKAKEDRVDQVAKLVRHFYIHIQQCF